MNPFNHYTITYKSVLSLFIALSLLAIIGKWNRYIFVESNLPYLLPILLLFVIVFGCNRIPKGLIFPWITFFMLIFISYMYIRIQNEHFSVFSKIVIENERLENGLIDIAYQLIFYVLFLFAALLYYKNGKFNYTLWLLICGYLFAFTCYNLLLDIINLNQREGNTPAGVLVIFTFVPFVFLRYEKKYLPHIIFFIFFIFMFLEQSRGTVLSLAVFYGCFIAWPAITRKKSIYYATFLIPLVLLIVLVTGYIWAMTEFGGLETINELSLAIFKKRIGTRFEVWNELLIRIQHHPLLGFGTEYTSDAFLGSKQYVYHYTYAPYLSSHSTYFEILLRLGIVGFILYFGIFFSIWKTFWIGRKELAVRVAGSFLIASFFFISTANYWIFIAPLRCGFGWIILGIGAGACLRAKKQQKYKGLTFVEHKRF